MTERDPNTGKFVRSKGPHGAPPRITICKKHNRPRRVTKDGRLVCPVCECPFENEVHETVFKENRNALIVVEGPPGTGKSYFCNRLGYDLDPRFFENPSITSEQLATRIFFKPSQFVKVLHDRKHEANLYKGAVLIIEEGGVQADHRKWYTFNNMVFNYILQTFRFMNLIVIFNVPVMQYIDSDTQKLFNYHVETLRVNYKEKLNHVKIKKQKYNSTMKRMYKPFLRYKINGRFMVIKEWAFHRAGKQLLKEYEKLHRDFKTGLIGELASEMRMIDKMENIKKRKVLIDEKAAAAQVVANAARYTKIIAGRKVVDRAIVETDFSVGRGIAERVKKQAEIKLNPSVDNKEVST